MTRALLMQTARGLAFAQGSQRGFNKDDFEAYLTSLLAGFPQLEDSSQAVLFELLGADMAITTDQLFVKRAGLRDFTNFIINGVVAVRKTGAFNTACAGGVYSLAAGAGNAWVAAGQSYAPLTGALKIVKATLAAIAGTEIAVNAPYLKLTTANGAALTADIYVLGQIID